MGGTCKGFGGRRGLLGPNVAEGFYLDIFQVYDALDRSTAPVAHTDVRDTDGVDFGCAVARHIEFLAVLAE